MLDEVDLIQNSMAGSKVLPNHTNEEKEFLLRLDVVECWHILENHENLKPWRWVLRSLPRTFSTDDIRAELSGRPMSLYMDQAYDLLDLMART